MIRMINRAATHREVAEVGPALINHRESSPSSSRAALEMRGALFLNDFVPRASDPGSFSVATTSRFSFLTSPSPLPPCHPDLPSNLTRR